MARTIRCDCGETLAAADDEELARVARGHANLVHPDREVTNTAIREWIAAAATDAADPSPAVGARLEG